MLDNPLKFIEKNLDEFLKLKNKSTSTEKLINLTEVVDDKGKLAIKKETVGITVINVEEEKVNKQQVPEIVKNNGRIAYLNPEIRLNVSLLFTAYHSLYSESLKSISHVIAYFQSQNVFRAESSPGLDSSVKKLIFELSSHGYEELSYIWGLVGASYRPSVVYKMRLVAIQEGLQRDSGRQVDKTDFHLHGAG